MDGIANHFSSKKCTARNDHCGTHGQTRSWFVSSRNGAIIFLISADFPIVLAARLPYRYSSKNVSGYRRPRSVTAFSAEVAHRAVPNYRYGSPSLPYCCCLVQPNDCSSCDIMGVGISQSHDQFQETDKSFGAQLHRV